jgi:hypothetical protein
MARSTTKEEAPTPRVSNELLHLEGCPADRIEAYHEMRPARPAQGIPSQPLTVTRCIDCGAHVIDEGHRWRGEAEPADDQGGTDDGTQEGQQG